MALSHPSGISSSWFIPHACLSLATPGPEFIIGLCIWLDVSFFPLSPLCTCLSTIDNIGGHLLCCSQGPKRIRRHNALVNVINNAFHKIILESSGALHDLGSRPSASCAGMAAVAGEVAKDEKHLAAVEKVGSDFIPLVVESFGVWTPFALKMQHLIADRTTPQSGVPRKLARKNLLQQLSVQLWMSNSKMILHYWARP